MNSAAAAVRAPLCQTIAWSESQLELGRAIMTLAQWGVAVMVAYLSLARRDCNTTTQLI